MLGFETGTYVAVGLLAISNIMIWARLRTMRIFVAQAYVHLHEAAQRIEALEKRAH